MRNKAPRFYGLRIYLITTVLYFFLVFPFLMIASLKYLPQVLDENKNTFSLNTENQKGNNQVFVSDSMASMQPLNDTTALNKDTSRGMVTMSKDGKEITTVGEEERLSSSVSAVFRALLVSYLLGLFFNYPFKRYFRLNRKGKKIPKRLYKFIKKWLLSVPIVNAIIFGGGLIFSLAYIFYYLQFSTFEDEINHSIFSQYFYISIIASILAFLLIYFWERHRVHLKYIEHVFSLEELKVRVFKKQKGKIGNRLLISNLMTSLLPLTIVMLYLFLSVTQIKDLNIDYTNPKQTEILFGTESSFFDEADNFSYEEIAKNAFVIYVNAWNSMFMFIGIFTGIFIAFIYLLLFVRWMTADIVRPVNELLAHMERTGKEHVNEFAIVRTNDEIGVLAEGYNFMTRRINQYIQNISKLNETYYQFVPEQFLKILGKKSIEEISHGDQIEKEMTVLFTDIRSFTEISEEMTPKENFDFINMYLAYMEPVIGRNNGFIDKFMGDSIMALFPYDVEDAINAAIEMRIKLAEFNQVINQFGKTPINSGIGIHTGLLMLGVVGGENRLDGTVISDAVNLASRLEGLTKIYGGSIIVSEDSLTKIQGSESYDYRFLDVVKVKGKKKAVYIFEVLNGEEERCRELKKSTKNDFGRAADMYQNKEFTNALEKFTNIYEQNSSDDAAKFYIERCKRFIKEGIPEDWDGIEKLRKI